MPEIIDDKSEHCIPFILDRIQHHRKQHEANGETPPPFFVGLNGVQGAGKTTLVTTLCKTLSSQPHNLPTVVLSIDDLYLPHDQQEQLAKSHPTNPLVQHRGQPSTHDIKLGTALFSSLQNRETNLKIPVYDKSAFNGSGDRQDESTWPVINAPGQATVDVIIFEGWCVGFRALSDEEVEQKWRAAKAEFDAKGDAYQGRLGKLELESVMFVNQKLREYDHLTDQFDAFMQIDAEDTQFVYAWRREQEAALRASKGKGMTDEQVVNFVNGYYPAYELYTKNLREGIYKGQKGRQLRLVVDRDRRVKEVVVT
ncbi:putative uridine/cytidine kinase [Acrodontium crateriforme]|uniref:Uridine/cytidine kinase n=1 Tax=Acrodontium crateriforme TaxID=150365 RepID=A0AAQ3M4R6_9PEZI|nr:putative uridine/cytidine kinase [Acrodontium crateriforme]